MWTQTCPRDAAAIGWGEISEKSSSIAKPSSTSIVLKAISLENGDIRSCNSESSSKYDGGIKSYKKVSHKWPFETRVFYLLPNIILFNTTSNN